MTIEDIKKSEEQEDFASFEEAFDALADDLVTDTKESETVKDTSPEDTAKQTTEESTDTSTNVDDAGTSTEDSVDWEARAKEWEQKFKSFEGRVQADLSQRRVREQEQQRMIELALRGAQAQQPQDQPKKDELPKHVSEFYEEFPDIATAVEDLIQLKMSGAKKYVDEVVAQRVNPVVNDFQKHQTNTHLSRILDKHPDAIKLMEDGTLVGWAEKLPVHAQFGAKAILNFGTSDEVVKLLDQFKDETKPKKKIETTPTNDGASKKSNDLAKEVKAGLVVKSSQSDIRTDVAKKNQDDFDAGWEDALKALKVV